MGMVKMFSLSVFLTHSYLVNLLLFVVSVCHESKLPSTLSVCHFEFLIFPLCPKGTQSNHKK